MIQRGGGTEKQKKTKKRKVAKGRRRFRTRTQKNGEPTPLKSHQGKGQGDGRNDPVLTSRKSKQRVGLPRDHEIAVCGSVNRGNKNARNYRENGRCNKNPKRGPVASTRGGS